MFKRFVFLALALAAYASAQCTVATPDQRVWQGTYAGGTTYALCDVVYYSNSAYTSIQASNVGHQPDTSTSYWTVLYSSPVNLQSTDTFKGSNLALNYNL